MLVGLLGAVVLAVLVACSPPAKRTARDRLVSLTPSATEIVAALGLTDRLVGVDRYSEYPEAVRALPKVGDFLQPDLEAILALRPDVVVLDAVQGAVADKLRSAGIQVVAIEMLRIADVAGALTRVARAFDLTEAGPRAAAAFDARLTALRAEAETRRAGRQPPTVLVVVDRRAGGLGGIYAAGPGTYIDELLGALGAKNALAASSQRYGQLAPDHIVTLAPEVILDLSPAGPEALADWDVLTSVPAVATRRVHAIVDPTLQAPGPRLDEGARRLLPALWP